MDVLLPVRMFYKGAAENQKLFSVTPADVRHSEQFSRENKKLNYFRKEKYINFFHLIGQKVEDITKLELWDIKCPRKIASSWRAFSSSCNGAASQ